MATSDRPAAWTLSCHLVTLPASRPVSIEATDMVLLDPNVVSELIHDTPEQGYGTGSVLPAVSWRASALMLSLRKVVGGHDDAVTDAFGHGVNHLPPVIRRATLNHGGGCVVL